MSYANQMILWRHLEVIESNSLGCLILEEKAVYSSPHFLVSPLTVLCLGSQWYYFLLGACLLVGSASGKGRLTACPCSCWCWWLWSVCPRHGACRPAFLCLQSHADLPSFPLLALEVGHRCLALVFYLSEHSTVCFDALLLEPGLTEQGMELPS